MSRLYVTLSAFLAEATGDSTYTNAAILSANWMKAHTLNTDYLVLDTMEANSCTPAPVNVQLTYNSGKFIEGLAVLAKVTGDSQWTDMYTNIAAASAKTDAWAGANGVITEGAVTAANSDNAGFKCGSVNLTFSVRWADAPHMCFSCTYSRTS